MDPSFWLSIFSAAFAVFTYFFGVEKIISPNNKYKNIKKIMRIINKHEQSNLYREIMFAMERRKNLMQYYEVCSLFLAPRISKIRFYGILCLAALISVAILISINFPASTRSSINCEELQSAVQNFSSCAFSESRITAGLNVELIDVPLFAIVIIAALLLFSFKSLFYLLPADTVRLLYAYTEMSKKIDADFADDLAFDLARKLEDHLGFSDTQRADRDKVIEWTQRMRSAQLFRIDPGNDQ